MQPALMASHHRLGEGSGLSQLTHDTLRMVVAVLMRGSPPGRPER